MESKISVIVSAYNEEKYLRATLESLKKSSEKFELIVICDSCEDGTQKIAENFTKKIYSVSFKNISKVRNFGAAKATGNIFVFSDADTIVSQNYPSEILNAIVKNYDYGSAKWVSESGNFLGKYVAKNNSRYNQAHNSVGGNFFVREKSFERIKGFDEKMIKGEDTDFGERLHRIGSKFAFLKKAFIIPSERRYKEKGYFTLILRSWKESFLYTFFRNYYNKEIAKP